MSAEDLKRWHESKNVALSKFSEASNLNGLSDRERELCLFAFRSGYARASMDVIDGKHPYLIEEAMKVKKE